MDLFSPKHLLIILVIVLLVFGTKKLKTLGSDLGGAVRGFKKAMSEGEQHESAATPPSPVTPPPRLTEPEAATEERVASSTDRTPPAGP